MTLAWLQLRRITPWRETVALCGPWRCGGTQRNTSLFFQRFDINMRVFENTVEHLSAQNLARDVVSKTDGCSRFARNKSSTARIIFGGLGLTLQAGSTVLWRAPNGRSWSIMRISSTTRAASSVESCLRRTTPRNGSIAALFLSVQINSDCHQIPSRKFTNPNDTNVSANSVAVSCPFLSTSVNMNSSHATAFAQCNVCSKSRLLVPLFACLAHVPKKGRCSAWRTE